MCETNNLIDNAEDSSRNWKYNLHRFQECVCIPFTFTFSFISHIGYLIGFSDNKIIQNNQNGND